MPRSITVYRVFIGSPGGLEAERQRFRDELERFSRVHSRHHDVEFEAVGWEDTLPGKGRPQAKINEDLEKCDYAIFAFHDRWGSPTGNGAMVGTEEEWEIAQRLYGPEGGYQIRQMALYFKSVPAAQAKDPGAEYQKVLAFKERVFAGKQHFCGKFDSVDEFGDQIEEHLSEWLARHLKPFNDEAFSQPTAAQDETAPSRSNVAFVPDFAFWIEEAKKARREEPPDHAASLSYVTRALAAALDDEQIVDALFNKGFALGALDRGVESIAVYDDLISRFGDYDSPSIQDDVTRALFNKGVRLGALDRSVEAIAVYDELISRFSGSDRPAIREAVGRALFNKGFLLGALDRSAEAVSVYDQLISRFGNSDSPAIQEQVARALYNKGVRLGVLDRNVEAIAAFDDLISRFGTSDMALMQERVAMALCSKGFRLGVLNRSDEAIAIYDDVVSRFGASDSPGIQEQVGRALYNKGIRLGVLDRNVEAIAAFDNLISRFGTSDAPPIQTHVAKALLTKALALGALGRSDEALAVCNELISRFATSDSPVIEEQVAGGLFNKACIQARQRRVVACIATLDEWAEKQGEFDCDAIANDPDFDAIRARPTFIKYLKDKGCSGQPAE